MADASTTTTTTTAPSGTVPTAQPSVLRRAAAIAALEKMPGAGDAGAAAAKPEAKVEPKVDAKPETKVEDPDDDKADEKPDADDKADEDADPDVDAAKADKADDDKDKPDAETQRRLDKVLRAEKRSRDALTAKETEMRAELDRAKQDVAQRESKVKETTSRIESAAKRAKTDPAGLLKAFGVTDDELEYAARQIYAQSPAAMKKPENREAAERMQRERERETEQSATAKRIEDLEQMIKTRDAEAEGRKAFEAFMDKTTKAIGDEAPVVATMLGKNVSKVRDKLAALAYEMLQRDGEAPDPVDVVAELEKRERADLEDRDIDVAEFIRGRKKKPAAGDDKKNAADEVDKKPATPARKLVGKTVAEKKAELLKDPDFGKL